MNNNLEKNNGIMHRGLPSWALLGRKTSGAWPRSWDKLAQFKLTSWSTRESAGTSSYSLSARLTASICNARFTSYSWITNSFLHDKVVVQQKLIQWWSQYFISWAVIYGVVNTTMFLHEWVWGFGFHCYHLDIACFYYFITTHIRYSSI